MSRYSQSPIDMPALRERRSRTQTVPAMGWSKLGILSFPIWPNRGMTGAYRLENASTRCLRAPTLLNPSASLCGPYLSQSWQSSTPKRDLPSDFKSWRERTKRSRNSPSIRRFTETDQSQCPRRERGNHSSCHPSIIIIKGHWSQLTQYKTCWRRRIGQ